MSQLIDSQESMYYLALLTGAAAFVLGAVLYIYHQRNYHNKNNRR